MNPSTLTSKCFWLVVFFALFALVFAVSSQADNINAEKAHYRVIVDAGSSHTEIVVLKTLFTEEGKLLITQTDSINLSITLASFATHPNVLSLTLIPSLQAVAKKLPSQTPIYVMATAGMRLLPSPERQRIFSLVKGAISTDTSLDPVFVGVISGKLEGALSWLAANYANNSLIGDKQHIQISELGGASAQITFEAPLNTHKHNKNDLVEIELGDRSLSLFSRSFLGLGQKEAYNKITENIEIESACYPTGYQFTDGRMASFNSLLCQSGIRKLLTSFRVKSTVPKQTNPAEFILLSGYYYTYDFYKLLNAPKQVGRVARDYCSTKSWSEIQAENPGKKTKSLRLYCLRGLYGDALTRQLHINNNKHHLAAVKKLNGQSVGWALGTAVYLAYGNNLPQV